jgi:hypothetical protein
MNSASGFALLSIEDLEGDLEWGLTSFLILFFMPNFIFPFKTHIYIE